MAQYVKAHGVYFPSDKPDIALVIGNDVRLHIGGEWIELLGDAKERVDYLAEQIQAGLQPGQDLTPLCTGARVVPKK